MGTRSIMLAVLSCALLTTASVLAFRQGAPTGYSGGPESNRWNCTACHGFNEGGGGVELFGVPVRYRPGTVYDLVIRVTDPVQSGAGFEMSAEGSDYAGTFLLSDPVGTRFADAGMKYVTHTLEGVAESVADWNANGGSYEFQLQWQAPDVDEGRVNFYASGNAINNSMVHDGDRYYFSYQATVYGAPNDADGDTDIDLLDAAAAQNCFGSATTALETCAFLDSDNDGTVGELDWQDFAGQMNGPIATLPGAYVMADEVRGGVLYDKWWVAADLPEPLDDHPLWSTRPDQASNTRTGSATWRCKECHGWDYKGVDGAYSSGNHRTGFAGIFETTMTPTLLFGLLKTDAATTTNGHDYASVGLTDEDIWDLVKMSLAGTVDTDVVYDADDPNGPFFGTAIFGRIHFENTCRNCHGPDGDWVPSAAPVHLGVIANDNPGEFLHKMRFGHPGAPMPPGEILRWGLSDFADIGAHVQTLPVE